MRMISQATIKLKASIIPKKYTFLELLSFYLFHSIIDIHPLAFHWLFNYLSAANSSLVFSPSSSTWSPEPGSGVGCSSAGLESETLGLTLVVESDFVGIVVVVVLTLVDVDEGFNVVDVEDVDEVVVLVIGSGCWTSSSSSSRLWWIGSSMKTGTSVLVVIPLAPSTPVTDNVSWSPTWNGIVLKKTNYLGSRSLCWKSLFRKP